MYEFVHIVGFVYPRVLQVCRIFKQQSRKIPGLHHKSYQQASWCSCEDQTAYETRSEQFMAQQLICKRPAPSAPRWFSRSPHKAPHWIATWLCHSLHPFRCAYYSGRMHRSWEVEPMSRCMTAGGRGRSKRSTNTPFVLQRMPVAAIQGYGRGYVLYIPSVPAAVTRSVGALAL